MLLTVVLALALGLSLTLVLKPSIALSPEGRAFAFAALCVAPVMVGLWGVDVHIEKSKTTEFCMSCHVMDLHAKSLFVDDDTLLAATHYQAGRVPREKACFTCHTTYTMYGDLAAKMNGLHHLWVNYIGKTPDEKSIKTYEPYNNRECLHCHDETRRFEQGKTHLLEPGRLAKIKSNEVSCLAKGCHEFVHDVANLEGLPLWSPKQK